MNTFAWIIIVMLVLMYLYGGINVLTQAELDYDNCSKATLVACRILEYTIFLPITILLIIAAMIYIGVMASRMKKP